MAFSGAGALALVPSPTSRSDPPPPSSKVCRNTAISCIPSHRTSKSTVSPVEHESTQNSSNDAKTFSYSRASPSVRWPHLKLPENLNPQPRTQFTVSTPPVTRVANSPDSGSGEETQMEDSVEPPVSDESEELLGRPSRNRVKMMNKFALNKAKDWRERVKDMTDRVLGLRPEEMVCDVLDDRKDLMTPINFCFVVKSVGQANWQRGLEVYEWLNMRHWFAPNAHLVSAILSVLGKANQEELAVEIFTRERDRIGDTVQVYNAMMGVYARNGRFSKVQELLDLMRKRGCVPNLVSFNTLINARLKSKPMVPNLAIELLNEVRKSHIRPDIITYNTLISACSRESNLEEAKKVFDDMEAHECQPDLWTYNAMISVYARCGLSSEAEELFNELASKGFYPDAVTYNSLLYAFAREGNAEKVKEVCDEMVKMGFGKDEREYNVIIHMYGKKGRHDLALQLYRDMKLEGRNPDAVTYTVLIDSLGKANKITEAANVMSEMINAGVKPTLQTYSALLSGYAKAGKRVEAEETFHRIRKSGIKPDKLAYSVMFHIFVRHDDIDKAIVLYKEMTRDGIAPEKGSYEALLRMLARENKVEDIENVVRDMEELCGMNPQMISSILVKGECYDQAAKMLRLAISNGYELDRENFLSILSSYSSMERHLEALELLEFLKKHISGSNSNSNKLISESLVVVHCKAKQPDAAFEEYSKNNGYGSFKGSSTMYEYLIQCCEEHERYAEASQFFSDLRFYGVDPSGYVYRAMVPMYCKLAFPETAHELIEQAEKKGIEFGDDTSIYIDVIEAYGRCKLWQKAESLVWSLKQKLTVDRKVWNALIHAYAASGCYERARAVFDTMMRDGPSPTVDSMNGLLQALIIDERLDELYVVIQELQDMGFKISKSSILLTLEAFAQAGNIFEVKKIYHGMTAAGYFPTMHLYRVMISLLCRGKRVKDAEAVVLEMQEAGFKPDLSIWNCMLRLYSRIENYKRTVEVYQQILEDGLKPDEDTYNTLIIMYCRDHRPEEGLSLMQEMRKLSLEPKLSTFKSLISAFAKQQLPEQAEELFEELRSKGYKIDRSFYHIMMKMFRSSGDHSKAEKLLGSMKEAGIEPTVSTMHLLMVSYGSSGQPEEAEKVLDNLKETGLSLDILPYSSVIDAYLKNGDYNAGVEKLTEMKNEGLEPDHKVWTCFVRAASLCQHRSDMFILLNALRDVGFDLPIRLLTQKSESLVSEVDNVLEEIDQAEDYAALNIVNALVDLLWAFELRATASWVLQLAIKKKIYRQNVFRVSEKDWGADFRKMSAGAALVGLTLWLDHMQDASLQGYPQSPKSVVLITGKADYNMVSLNSTVKIFLWEMASPFLPCKTRTGLLVAKAHSLRMWLKDSPFCLDLELKDAPSLPEKNSMQLVDGCFMRRGLVPAFKDITERLGIVMPKKFARLALLSDDKRGKVIQRDIDGREEKLAKMKRRVEFGKLSEIKKSRKARGRSVQRSTVSRPLKVWKRKQAERRQGPLPELVAPSD